MQFCCASGLQYTCIGRSTGVLLKIRTVGMLTSESGSCAMSDLPPHCSESDFMFDGAVSCRPTRYCSLILSCDLFVRAFFCFATLAQVLNYVVYKMQMAANFHPRATARREVQHGHARQAVLHVWQDCALAASQLQVHATATGKPVFHL